MNANLKTVLIVVVALVAFRVLDKLFLDKALANVFNWEAENFETKQIGGWKVTKPSQRNILRTHKRVMRLAA